MRNLNIILASELSHGSTGLLKPGDEPFTVLGKDAISDRIRCRTVSGQPFSLDPNTKVLVEVP